jgi:16S rRNA (guanine966-N2)-methyltransferase
MKIIAGTLKGRRLVSPRGLGTRPTADQVRIALMDTLMPRLPGARFLDLFAGAGGVGLEALSRGAARAVFVERDAAAVEALRRNVGALGVDDRTRVLRADVERALGVLTADGERFELVFLDPPYGADLVEAALARLGAGGLTVAGALVVAQHFTKQPPPGETGALIAFRTRRFGETTLTFFRSGSNDAGTRGNVGGQAPVSSEGRGPLG